MHDDELKARLASLRVPPVDAAAQSEGLRRALEIFARPAPANEPWTWRDWLWPSPLAWGAMAGLWIAALAHEVATRPEHPLAKTGGPFPPAPLFASRDLREMIREFQSSQTSR